MEKSLTQIKFNKTSCYFCNEWLENNDFKNHLLTCGQILEKCPNQCTAFIERKMIDSHLKDCPKTIEANIQNSSVDYVETVEMSEIMNRLTNLEQDITNLRLAINEETRQRHRLIVDVGGIRKRNLVSDEWTCKVGDVLSALRKCLNEETDSRCIDIRQCRTDIERLMEQYEQIESIDLVKKLSEIDHEFLKNDNVMRHIEVIVNDLRIAAMKICNLEDQVENLKLKQAEQFLQMNSNDSSEITSVDDKHEKENSISTNLLIKNKIPVDLKLVQNSIAQIRHKFQTLDFEVKSIKHIATDTEDKCDKLEKIINEVRHVSCKTKQQLSDLQVHLINQKKLSAIQNTKGHLIWRIDEYSEKLATSKEADIKLKSPLFCNRQYGYTLRMEVNLNGIGTWKGRNLIACISVVNGEWDPLLPWPCKLQADIILRDQPKNITEAKNYTKSLSVKRKNEKCEQNQFIHIPHKTIESCNYLRNDAIFFEVRVYN